jgi:peptidoglycan/xylan/chitin deacetylase (PgdA/CDA1 family)
VPAPGAGALEEAFMFRVRRPVAVTAAIIATIAAGPVWATTAAPAAAATCGSGYVALTYDDGPTGSTGTLLNALRARGVRATFFDIGSRVQGNPAAVRSVRDAGMWVHDHSWSHPHMTQLSAAQMRSELTMTQQALQQAAGLTPRIFRPPFGETNSMLQSVASQLGLSVVTWTVDSQDWNGASTAQIVQAAGTLQPGGVILMHDGIQNTINAVPQIVANLGSRNLCAGMINPATGRAVAPA